MLYYSELSVYNIGMTLEEGIANGHKQTSKAVDERKVHHRI